MGNNRPLFHASKTAITVIAFNLPVVDKAKSGQGVGVAWAGWVVCFCVAGVAALLGGGGGGGDFGMLKHVFFLTAVGKDVRRWGSTPLFNHLKRINWRMRYMHPAVSIAVIAGKGMK